MGANNEGVTRTIRDLRPTHYLFQIVSYSSLKDERYESDVFEAGGYKWKLRLYPNGHTKRNGNGYVSLYLTIVETNTFPHRWEVNVNFKLFLFDQIRDKYLVIQDDGEGGISRFHKMKTEWGFSQLVPLDVLNNASNGYLINDSCLFGAEVFVLKSPSFRSDCFVPKAIEPKNDTFMDTYVWKVEKFSTLRNQYYYSEVFTLVGMKWKLLLYPQGDEIGKDKAMSLFLVWIAVPKKYSLKVNFNLSLRNQVDNNHHTREIKVAPLKPYRHGLSEFITIAQVYSPGNPFLKDDTLTIEAQITEVSFVNKGPAILRYLCCRC